MHEEPKMRLFHILKASFNGLGRDATKMTKLLASVYRKPADG